MMTQPAPDHIGYVRSHGRTRAVVGGHTRKLARVLLRVYIRHERFTGAALVLPRGADPATVPRWWVCRAGKFIGRTNEVASNTHERQTI